MNQPLSLVDTLRDAVERPDFDRLSKICAAVPSACSSSLVRAILRVLTVRVAQLAEAERIAFVQSRLASLGPSLARLSLESEPEALTDLYLVAGMVQKAMELCSHGYRQNLGHQGLAHRLGTALLARAQATPASDRTNSVERWGNAITYLTTAVWDNGYWNEWVKARGQVYGEQIEEETRQAGREQLLAQLRRLLTARAEEVDANHPQTGAALRDLLVDLEVETSGLTVFERGRSLSHVAGAQSVPLPFGMNWYRRMGAPTQAKQLLGEVIARVQGVPSSYGGGPPEPAAEHLGTALRQCYSRLAPVRYALLQGQAETARKNLQTLCPSEETCQRAKSTGWRKVVGGPSTCDAGCTQFVHCNPGYALLENPTHVLAADAQLLAMRTALALAGTYVSTRPPQLLPATREWLLARSIADVLGISLQFHEELLGQILGHLEDLTSEPEHAAELVQKALVVLPTEELRGTLSDRLTERGIHRANQEQLNAGAQDLRHALTLNGHSIRSRHNLCLILKAIAVEHHNCGQINSAREVAAELCELAESTQKLGFAADTFTPLLEWGRNYLTTWQEGEAVDILERMLRQFNETDK
ncbi:MAG: hypothetical protein U0840_11125 [Gemmataceae bacterium]